MRALARLARNQPAAHRPGVAIDAFLHMREGEYVLLDRPRSQVLAKKTTEGIDLSVAPPPVTPVSLDLNR